MEKEQIEQKLKSFEDLKVWSKSRDLTNKVYLLSNQNDTFSKDFAFRDQMRKCAVSIVSNIAEGYERVGDREFVRFLSIAKGSAGEFRAQLYIAKDLGYINDYQFNELYEMIVEISKMLGGFINYLNNSKSNTL